MSPRFLEQKRCRDGFFVQKGLVSVICNGNTASETTLRAAPLVLRVRLTSDALDACDLIFSPPTSVGRSDCGTSPHNGRCSPRSLESAPEFVTRHAALDEATTRLDRK